MSTRRNSDAIYVVGDSARERQRLQDQASILDPFTRRLFANAGIMEGMRVLDVGSGVGDLAFLLSEMVGASGRVVGVDSNPAVLETARQRASAGGYSNVSFTPGDVRQIDLEDDFDAVAGRLVLMYLKDPAAAIENAARHLRPGGIVAFLEPDLTAGFVSVPPSPLVEKIGYWIRETFTRAGVETQMGLRLRETFTAAGLEEPQMQADAIVGGGHSWAAYQYTEDTLRSMLPVMLELGVTTTAEIDIDTLADRLHDEVTGLNSAAMLSVWLGVWSRKPQLEP